MSDKEEELTEEQIKEQKLEAARKKVSATVISDNDLRNKTLTALDKYEELKNKNKKKKKKSKKDKKEDDKEEESIDAADDAKEEEGTKAEEVAEENLEQQEKQDPIQEEKSSEDDVKQDAEAKPEKDETDSKTEIEAKPTEEEEITKDLNQLKVEDLVTEEKVGDAGPSTTDPSDDLFPDSGPSFMDTIKQESLSNEALSRVQEENQSLKQELEKLRTENKSLKMLKLEHLDQIETLEVKVTDLESKLAKAKVDSSSHNNAGPSAYDQDDAFSLSPTPSFQQSFPTSFSQFKPHHKNESQLSVAELKARLNKWKGWNIDMTNWRSVGSGPIVEL